MQNFLVWMLGWAAQLELLAKFAVGVDRYHYLAVNGSVVLFQVTLELPLQPVRVQRNAFGPAGIWTILKRAPVHHFGGVGYKIVAAMARPFSRNGGDIGPFGNSEIVMACNQLDVDGRIGRLS